MNFSIWLAFFITATVASFAPGTADSDIARQVFAKYAGTITPDHIEDTPPPTNTRPPEQRQRGTDIQLLRQLAQRNDFVCGVVPTSVPAVSSGIFHSLKVFTDAPPALVLLGAKRNIEAFDVRLNAQGQSNVVASTLSFSNKQVVTRRSQVRDISVRTTGSGPGYSLSAFNGTIVQRVLAHNVSGAGASSACRVVRATLLRSHLPVALLPAPPAAGPAKETVAGPGQRILANVGKAQRPWAT